MQSRIPQQKKRWLSITVTLILSASFQSGCDSNLSEAKNAHVSESEKHQANVANNQKKPSVVEPNDNKKPPIKYTIINDIKTPPTKRSVDIRLEKRFDKKDLERLAMYLKSSEPTNYNRTFISYYLPDMNVGSGAWATSHFNPDLDVKILGTSIEQAKSPYPPLPSGASLIAKFDGNKFLGEKAIIFKDAQGSYKQSSVYKDGSGNVTNLYSQDGKRFDTRNSHGEYLVITSNSVASYDNEGLFETYQRKDK